VLAAIKLVIDAAAARRQAQINGRKWKEDEESLAAARRTGRRAEQVDVTAQFIPTDAVNVSMTLSGSTAFDQAFGCSSFFSSVSMNFLARATPFSRE
jgi:hypothetical protein